MIKSNTIGLNNSMTSANSQETSATKGNNEKSIYEKTGKAMANTLFNRMPDSAGKELGAIIMQLLA